jgi:hypothetical protein
MTYGHRTVGTVRPSIGHRRILRFLDVEWLGFNSPDLVKVLSASFDSSTEPALLEAPCKASAQRLQRDDAVVSEHVAVERIERRVVNVRGEDAFRQRRNAARPSRTCSRLPSGS